MLTPEEIKRKLKSMNIVAVSKETGVHKNSIYRLMKEGSKPSYETIKALSDFLKNN